MDERVPKGICNARGIAHLSLQLLDLLVVLIQALTDGLLEVINLHKIWEERQDVLNVDQSTGLPQQFVDPLDALVLHHPSACGADCITQLSPCYPKSTSLTHLLNGMHCSP